MTKGSSLNLVYAREYQDPEDYDYFYIYYTIFRNAPLSQLKRFSDKDFQNKIKTYCDKNYTESATNGTGHSKVVMIHGDEYYQTYEDVFGTDTVKNDNALFTDFGQLWNGRQFFKYDFAPSLTNQFTHKHLNTNVGGYTNDN